MALASLLFCIMGLALSSHLSHPPQQYAAKLVVMPHVYPSPEDSESQARVDFTAVGTYASSTNPVPSWPDEPAPQQYAFPLTSMPQTCVMPADKTAHADTLELSTARGDSETERVLLPSAAALQPAEGTSIGGLGTVRGPHQGAVVGWRLHTLAVGPLSPLLDAAGEVPPSSNLDPYKASVYCFKWCHWCTERIRRRAALE